MHHGKLSSSPRLQRALRTLQRAKGEISTRELAERRDFRCQFHRCRTARQWGQDHLSAGVQGRQAGLFLHVNQITGGEIMTPQQEEICDQLRAQSDRLAEGFRNVNALLTVAVVTGDLTSQDDEEGEDPVEIDQFVATMMDLMVPACTAAQDLAVALTETRGQALC